MPTSDYMAEHKKLIALLNDISGKAKAEATEQTPEVKQRRGRGRPKKCVNDVDGGCGMCGGTKGMKQKDMMGGRLYCGDKGQTPSGATQGSRGSCFKKGIGVGLMIASQKKDNIKPEQLQTMTIRELGQLASKMGVSKYGKMKKAELIEAIEPLL